MTWILPSTSVRCSWACWMNGSTMASPARGQWWTSLQCWNLVQPIQYLPKSTNLISRRTLAFLNMGSFKPAPLGGTPPSICWRDRQEQKRALNLFAVENGGFTSLITDQWSLVAKLVETLTPIEEVTLEMNHHKSSPSCIIPSVKDALLRWRSLG